MTLEELYRYIGETVTVFTTSGGASGCGFTGTLLRVNPCFITLVNQFGTAPANPLSEVICGDRMGGDRMGGGDTRDGRDGRDCRDRRDRECFRVGAVIDIPVDRIAAFVHNAI